MAEEPHRMEVDRNQFYLCCSVCLDLLNEPVTIPCGHTYCKSCILGCWEPKEMTEFRCPQCREAFRPRPLLRRNNILAEVVEKLKKSSPQPPSAVVDCAGPSDVSCDFCCSAQPNKAVMSCLTCLASYCPSHLEPHYSVPVLKEHLLVSATTPLQEKMCKKHNRLMVYCPTDKKCICYLCAIDEHKLHLTSSAAAERAKEQVQLFVIQKKVQERGKERENELNQLVQALKDFKSCSQTAAETSDEFFDELISSLKKKCALTKQLMKAQEHIKVAEAHKLQLQLEEEITKLRARDAQLQQLSHVDDHIHFIQTFRSLSTSCESPDLPSGPLVIPQHSFKTATDCLSKLRDDVESLLKETWPRIPAIVSLIDVVLPPAPKTREEFLQYCCPLELDGNTAHSKLSLSEKGRRVTSIPLQSRSFLDYGRKSERFTYARQVLCREGLTARCYWEVRRGCSNLSVAVAYKEISRTSLTESEFGKDKKSWSLECSGKGFTFHHDKRSLTVLGPTHSRVGVYLDYKAGTLSFYSISNRMTLLHHVQTTFTQPLYPGLKLGDEESFGYHAELVKLQ